MVHCSLHRYCQTATQCSTPQADPLRTIPIMPLSVQWRHGAPGNSSKLLLGRVEKRCGDLPKPGGQDLDIRSGPFFEPGTATKTTASRFVP